MHATLSRCLALCACLAGALPAVAAPDDSAARIALIDPSGLRVFPSADARYFLTQSRDGLRWWERAQGRILADVPGPGDLSLANPVAPVGPPGGDQLYFATADEVLCVSLAEGRVTARHPLPGIDLLHWDDARRHLLAIDNDAAPGRLAVHTLDAGLNPAAPPVTLPVTLDQPAKSWDPRANGYGGIHAVLPAPGGGWYFQVNPAGDFLARADLKGDGYDGVLALQRQYDDDQQLLGELFTVGDHWFSLENHNRHGRDAYLHVLDPATLHVTKTFPFRTYFSHPARVRLVRPFGAAPGPGPLLFTDGYELHLIDPAASADTPARVIDTRAFGFSERGVTAAWADAGHTRLFLADDTRFGVFTLTPAGLEERQDFRQGFARFTSLARDPLTHDLLATDSSHTLWRLGLRENGVLVSAVGPGVVQAQVDPGTDTLFVLERKQGASLSAKYTAVFSTPEAYPGVKLTAGVKSGWGDEVPPHDVVFSPSGALAVVHDAVIDVATGEKRFPIPDFSSRPPTGWPDDHADRAAICQDDAVLVVRQETLGRLAAYDCTTGTVLWEKPLAAERAARLIGFDDDNRLQVLLSAPFELQTLDRDTGETLRHAALEIPGAPTAPFALTFAADRSAALLRHGDRTSLIRFPTGTVAATFPTPGEINAWWFDAASPILIGAPARGGLLILSAATGETLTTLALKPATRQWAAFAPDGRFDMAGSMADDLYRVVDGTAQSLGQFQNLLLQPGLLGTVLGPAATPAPAPVLPGLAELPTLRLALTGTESRGLFVEDDIPTVATDAPAVSLTLTASGPNLAAAQFRLYQNGKLLGQGTRGLFVEDDDAATSNTFREKVYQVPLLPGENRFRAVAVTPDGIESLPAGLVVASRSPDAGSGGLRLHALVIGVNTYQNPKYNLNYAVGDAEAFAAALDRGARDIYTGVSVTTLLDADATKARIAEAFRRIAATAGPRDTFVFYFAGHGTVSTGERAAFYLAPTGLTQLYTGAASLDHEAIGTDELLAWSADIPAQKQLFLLDACQSGEALEAVARRGAAEEKAIAQLARSSGTHWLTATGSQQFATEVAELGHGLFTYALLAAMRGEADAGDGLVSVNELKADLETVVPELSAAHRGSAQFPASFGTGQDFPLVRVVQP
ncbi:MAG: caspase family protein [Opitutaceae bacterium]|nr:caspase family protein [Cephaloticoccus sp.]MCP5529334.1 caspase family protein [Opitutaceae bacterium]